MSVRVVSTSTVKLSGALVGAAVCMWLGFLAINREPFTAWLVIIVCGVGALVVVALLLSGGSSLRLDQEGVEQVNMFRRTRFLWKDIESINMTKTRGGSVIALNFKSGHPRHSEVSRSLVGIDAVLGNIYSVSLEELCAELQNWHQRYGKASAHSGN